MRRFDEVRARMRGIVEMPDRKEQSSIKICLHNRGRLYAELDDATIAALEEVVREAMTDSTGELLTG